MPRIDPLSLLKCLSVLLGPTGGIKSKEEVHRLANLMTKFSKKLVSKCIYIQILKTTNTDLLSQFMGAGGWNLIHMWLTDGILAKNWALIQELLELLLLCPVDIERLKSNNCPKLVKGLSKEGSHQGVRVLASRLVEQWLKIVKGEAAPNSVPAQIMTIPVQTTGVLGQSFVSQSPQQQQYSIHCGTQQTISDGTEAATVQVQDLQFITNSTSTIAVSHIQPQQQHSQEQQQTQERTTIQPLQLQVVSKPQQVQLQQQLSSQKKPAFVVVSTSSQSPVPVYKITIREGKQILTTVETDATNINSVLNTNSTNVEVNGDAVDDNLLAKQTSEEEASMELSDGVVSGQDCENDIAQSEKLDQVSSEVKQTVTDTTDNPDVEVKNKDSKDSKDNGSENSKSSNKENRDSSKKDEKKSSSSDKKSHHSLSSSSKSSSKHSSSSSSHRSSSTSYKSSSHRSSSSSNNSSSKSSSSKDKSSKDKDKHHSSSKHSSSKNKTDKEREKEKQKKDQAEKDKATLEKVQGQALSSKFGKIPKKKADEEKSSGDAAVRKSSTDSRDSSKENKTDAKKVSTMPEKKNISISIESRKNSQDSIARPKTVKTFNSKFRSTGLEEEVKPPPPRSAKKSNPVIDKKVIPQKLPTLKRPSPLRESIPTTDKRPKLSLDSPTTPPVEEKKGGIKLIPPKPKPMVLQESDMFMDALTASTKSKEPRKRKRRTSITKDGPTEVKKQETASSNNRDVTTPPTSPTSADEKSPVVIKPNFKFYQDTLETEEDKEQKERENSEDDAKKEKEEATDDQKENRIYKAEIDDDTGSNTPTPEEDVDEKASDSPEDTSSDSTKKDSVGPYPEIRYVDGLRSVLLLQKRKGAKKVLKWKTDLESVRYFELDETERVNVTKTFTDMKQMEKQNEREAFQMARKLSNEDLMEERTRWKALIPIDLPPPLVEPGKDSREKDIQYAREKGILQALYFNRSMIPDSAAEPDEERHHIFSEPKIIPLEDLTGNKESEKDFTSMPWPEPKPQLQPQTPPVTNFHYPTFNQQPVMASMGPQTSMGPMPQMSQQMMGPTHMGPMASEMGGPMPTTAGGGWRTGDGKVVVPDAMSINPMGNIPNAFPPGMEGGPMVPPGMMGPPPMFNQQQEGYGMMGPDDMGFNNMNPNNFQGPPGPMYGPGPNFQGPRGGGPMHARGRGVPGPGWYRGGGGPPGRGGWRGGGGGGGWRGNGKQPPVCRQFSKNGYCRVGDKCQYLHPGVNCPPF
ncbi:serine/threonine-protein phosphatase 1 regulatory subunit 10-like isoform X2 [Ceratina calcarata]|uniref:Serine/threonine-protein phosphatase 1 regulatory subunit 10-like isoform X2 n=1 Tax=Ceratina calcarata TaxID=156304 RepID=A0AAJ7S3P3_9HYME|nr:serine/threonine-protein phosphatase 1 regulatory subunit 10-like isoform X2 [Ceratina calcarata]XP_017882179.1 serine/threonine-protein phosphatase 1 regulatory subunit 10-like isoform X2 [Ceratina calcarata]XP_026670353.1 serine/threonine-protein phosphatase 1 regulatory subunit 10-like isoform X2 [Ceratina calcarata]XP_026670354.1 serine/threonine-protein phosphatase 1 regulatory subunit 10-like isoform X2 [Ceratina calcarata]